MIRRKRVSSEAKKDKLRIKAKALNNSGLSQVQHAAVSAPYGCATNSAGQFSNSLLILLLLLLLFTRMGLGGERIDEAALVVCVFLLDVLALGARDDGLARY